MALTFSGSGQYLLRTGAVVTAMPLTLAAWVNLSSLAAASTIINVSSSTADDTYLIHYSLGMTEMSALIENAAGTDDQSAAPTTAIATGTWYHVCGVFTSSTSRTCYVNGTGAVTSVVSIAPTSTNINNMSIGVSNAAATGGIDSPAFGTIAFPAIWNVALTAADVAALAAGASPKKVRPQGLVSYTRMSEIDSPVPDLCGGTWTVTGSPTAGANPRIYRV
jgi:hypothetical protein